MASIENDLYLANLSHAYQQNGSFHFEGPVLSYEELVQELSCFNATLEAVPSKTGQLFLVCLYSFTSFVALMGNVTVIVVELLGSESAVNIRKYLINLAVSDIIIGVLCVPFTYTDFMLGQWIFPHWLCPTAQYVQLLSVFVTSLTLTIIGVERYMATLHPFSNVHRWLECHTHIMLWLTWVLGAMYAYIPIANTYTRPFTHENVTYYECSYDNEISELKRRLFAWSNFVLTFLLPLVVLICSYSAIMCKLLADQRSRQPPALRYGKAAQSKTSSSELTTGAPHSTTTTTSTSVDSANYTRQSSDQTNSRSISAKVPRARRVLASVVPKRLLIKPRKLLNISSSKTAKCTADTTDSGPKSADSGPNCNDDNNNSNAVANVTATVHTLSCNSNNGNFNLRKSAPNNHRSKTIKMMFTVILLYGICWMPIKLYQFLLDYGLIAYCTKLQLYALVTVYFVCHWIAMANSFVNPIVYSFMSKSFRNDFRKITKTFRATFRNNTKHQSSLKTISTQV